MPIICGCASLLLSVVWSSHYHIYASIFLSFILRLACFCPVYGLNRSRNSNAKCQTNKVIAAGIVSTRFKRAHSRLSLNVYELKLQLWLYSQRLVKVIQMVSEDRPAWQMCKMSQQNKYHCICNSTIHILSLQRRYQLSQLICPCYLFCSWSALMVVQVSRRINDITKQDNFSTIGATNCIWLIQRQGGWQMQWCWFCGGILHICDTKTFLVVETLSFHRL